MSKIVTISLSYVDTEDRIKVAMRLADGSVAGVWLTQRLARRLVAALAAHLEGAEAIPLPAVRDAVMAQEQAQAVSSIKPVEPVTLADDMATPQHLVTNVRVGLAADHVNLAFVSQLDIEPSVTLDRTLVRQWLSMLHRQFLKAEWPQDVWPHWLIEGSGDAAEHTRH